MKRDMVRLLAVFAAVGLLAAACGDDTGGGDPESASDDTAVATTTTDTAVATTTTDAAVATTTTAIEGRAAAACAAEVDTQSLGELTVATYPLYLRTPDDFDQVNGLQAYENAVVYAVADQLGFAEDQVVLEEVAFAVGPDEDLAAPGEKDFDVAVSNISVTAERDEAVDFVVDYDEQQVLVAPEDSVVIGAASLGDLSDDTFGTMRQTASLTDGAGTAYVEEVIAPSTEVMEFPSFFDPGDLAAVQNAIDDGTIDALVIDQPSAEFALESGPEGAQLTGVSIVGVLPRTDPPSGQLGMVLEEGSDLTSCVELAMTALQDDGTIEDLETEYLRNGGTIPELSM